MTIIIQKPQPHAPTQPLTESPSIRDQKPRPQPYALPEPHQQKRHGEENERDYRQHRRAPADAEPVVQAWGDQGESGAGDAAEADGGGDGGGGVEAEGVDEVAEGREDGGGDAEAERGRRDDGGGPGGAGLHRPAVPEQGGGDDEAAGDHGGQALFGRHGAAGLRAGDVAVEGRLAEEQACGEADACGVRQPGGWGSWRGRGWMDGWMYLILGR